jgi:hypothetical protein
MGELSEEEIANEEANGTVGNIAFVLRSDRRNGCDPYEDDDSMDFEDDGSYDSEFDSDWELESEHESHSDDF